MQNSRAVHSLNGSTSPMQKEQKIATTPALIEHFEVMRKAFDDFIENVGDKTEQQFLKELDITISAFENARQFCITYVKPSIFIKPQKITNISESDARKVLLTSGLTEHLEILTRLFNDFMKNVENKSEEQFLAEIDMAVSFFKDTKVFCASHK